VHYNMGKHAVIGLMRSLANELAPHFIRANTIHPSSTNTKMIQNETIWSAFAPGVENPTVDDFGDTFTAMNLLPVPWMEPVDISHAVAWLASDESRYVTGVTLPSMRATSRSTTDDADAGRTRALTTDPERLELGRELRGQTRCPSPWR